MITINEALLGGIGIDLRDPAFLVDTWFVMLETVWDARLAVRQDGADEELLSLTFAGLRASIHKIQSARMCNGSITYATYQGGKMWQERTIDQIVDRDLSGLTGRGMQGSAICGAHADIDVHCAVHLPNQAVGTQKIRRALRIFTTKLDKSPIWYLSVEGSVLSLTKATNDTEIRSTLIESSKTDSRIQRILESWPERSTTLNPAIDAEELPMRALLLRDDGAALHGNADLSRINTPMFNEVILAIQSFLIDEGWSST